MKEECSMALSHLFCYETNDIESLGAVLSLFWGLRMKEESNYYIDIEWVWDFLPPWNISAVDFPWRQLASPKAVSLDSETQHCPLVWRIVFIISVLLPEPLVLLMRQGLVGAGQHYSRSSLEQSLEHWPGIVNFRGMSNSASDVFNLFTRFAASDTCYVG